ncbi:MULTISPECIES: enoyl-CoA hydratase/isomerase family protein [unclassified Sphingobium]|uniref:enoyl-CoA hydratase/isomerase family protein n=1 Tax=unclassified Sphingobium TaxID=2611147 RepID=UPI000D168B78|nr:MULTISPECIES: enoyl-CoA hydratase-related protein [unclassified Sphingobium]MBG6120110.1 enoyl-CoA hydratase [Sphingobium sp. JAI105]PSO13098.1 enoyl-CoA hydratase [Sphingobium sp. AEW4]TWD05689.1 enoyl-CoA hydratase [Sphingobium sp. AEW010]TWD23242.1 enoyl-CoA hydratase [Sphingobium sp. AEW013]TWD25102.1 enoyl-CoA hydratase [Sphingobium sp. AEW001]
MNEILVDTPVEGVRRLTFNRPDALNSLTFTMYERLLELLAEIEVDPTVRVVVLTGAGRGFCAGHDLRAGGKPEWVSDDLGRAQRNRAVMLRLGQIPLRMRALPQPIIVAINGTVAGAGYSIALAGDMCLAAQSAKFVNAFHNAGTGHELGLSYMLPRAVGAQRAAELLLTGRAVKADEAAQIGLVLRTVADDQLEAEALALAESIMVNSPIGVQLTKSSMWLNADAGSLAAAIELENRGIFISQTTEDTAEKRKSFIEKRRPAFTGR